MKNANIEKLTYKERMTGAETWRFVKSISFPIIILFISVYTISSFAKFGTRLISPLVAIMWLVAVVEALFFGAQRKTILNEALIFIGSYDVGLLALKMIIGFASNATTEQLVASFNRNITLSQSNALPGYLQNALWITAVMVPIGYLGMQAKRIFQFKKKVRKDKFFEQTRSIR